MKYELYNLDCLKLLDCKRSWTCIFADPPDNIGLKYKGVSDKRPATEYLAWLDVLMERCVKSCEIFWLSFNSRHTPTVGRIAERLATKYALDVLPCVQIFTFATQQQHDLKDAHRPLWRFTHRGARLYPDSIRVESWRLANGDRRADPRGCVPGNVFDFPRVVGNNPQRRAWHETQLHEGLVERAIRLSTARGDSVYDPFGGSGTTLRVCRRLRRSCTLTELSADYCEMIAKENSLDGYGESGEDFDYYATDEELMTANEMQEFASLHFDCGMSVDQIAGDSKVNLGVLYFYLYKDQDWWDPKGEYAKHRILDKPETLEDRTSESKKTSRSKPAGGRKSKGA